MDTFLAAQMYSVREFMKTPKDMATSLARIKKVGYDAVQLSGQGPVEPADMRKMLDDNGLLACATHISFDQMQHNLKEVIERHHLWETQYVGVGAMPDSYRQDADGYKRFAQEASEIALQLQDEGLTFVYHNHQFEFTRFGSLTGMDILLRESHPAFEFELDTYWAQTGGGDPAAWIDKLAYRMSVIHFKDMRIVGGQPEFAEIGEGNLNWPAILGACEDAGLEWYIIEQDDCPGDPFDSLALSLRNLRGMGVR